MEHKMQMAHSKQSFFTAHTYCRSPVSDEMEDAGGVYGLYDPMGYEWRVIARMGYEYEWRVIAHRYDPP